MPTLPLEQMTVKEKLQIMEELWSDLCSNQNDIPVLNGTKTYWTNGKSWSKEAGQHSWTGKPQKDG
ncbi:MAG: addiction module protein [Thermodesulfobacteriota bacterium]|nr:addiction module protein [Thermodesulfobacteriota bacterium]